MLYLALLGSPLLSGLVGQSTLVWLLDGQEHLVHQLPHGVFKDFWTVLPGGLVIANVQICPLNDPLGHGPERKGGGIWICEQTDFT